MWIWLKAFESASIDSHYMENGKLVHRTFDFTLTQDENDEEVTPSEEKEEKTTVRLIGMRSPYKENCPVSLQTIGRRLVEHCLPYFLDTKCPSVTIRDEHEDINLNNYFHENFAVRASNYAFDAGDESFRIKGLRIYHSVDSQHRLMYAANSREVLQEKLEKYLPNSKKAD